MRYCFIKDYLDDAPAFAKGDVKKLREYIKNAVMEGDDSEILYEIDNGRIKPSKRGVVTKIRTWVLGLEVS